MTKREWIRVIIDNRRMILTLAREAFAARRGRVKAERAPAEYQADAG